MFGIRKESCNGHRIAVESKREVFRSKILWDRPKKKAPWGFNMSKELRGYLPHFRQAQGLLISGGRAGSVFVLVLRQDLRACGLLFDTTPIVLISSLFPIRIARSDNFGPPETYGSRDAGLWLLVTNKSPLNLTLPCYASCCRPANHGSGYLDW